MTTKECIGCGQKFSTDSDMQVYHNNFCATGGPKWRTSQKLKEFDVLNAAKLSGANTVVENGPKTLSTEPKAPLEVKSELPKPQQNPVKNIIQTQQPPMPKEQKEDAKMSNEKENTRETTMPETKQNYGSPSVPAESAGTVATVLKKQFLTSEQENFHSTDLIDSSARELHSQLKGMFANKPDAEIVKYDPERVQIACLAAKQITGLLRLKLDIYKTHKEVNGL